MRRPGARARSSALLPNHVTARLSLLDVRMVECVPPGGNWKNIPKTVPSKRLQQIRTSFAAGYGSRSTYYGRLLADEPSYTISTHFNRPGNGCFIHYDYVGGQHRMISQREAARLQTFPDSFIFSGPQGSVNTQIGNAVPPLLAFRLAACFPEPGVFVDLFCGSGGSALGFSLAGWKAAVSNDIDRHSLETHTLNFANPTVLGDIRHPAVSEEVVRLAKRAFRHAHGPFALVGGPPCQGISTAGNRRSMNDERNFLFRQYAAILKSLAPDYFVFENVMGIRNMERGRLFDLVTATLTDAGYDLSVAIMRTEEHGIPQRRARVIILGTRHGISSKPHWPEPITQVGGKAALFERPRAPSVKDAIGDLPGLSAGQDGSTLPYALRNPATTFQMFVRGTIDASTYLMTTAAIKRSA